MGYCASGQGSVVFKDNVNTAKVIEVLRDLPNSEIEFEVYDKGVGFLENDTHWHEEDTMEFLEALNPYITEGCANYSGE